MIGDGKLIAHNWAALAAVPSWLLNSSIKPDGYRDTPKVLQPLTYDTKLHDTHPEGSPITRQGLKTEDQV
jgi:hypothetical protein